ncbi:MAG: hypothetical protein MUE70_12040 [Desulfobacterales bacterium]|jgi:hypothetical protein|nr:hypothetical protein [Desulfobacterales bacterium]
MIKKSLIVITVFVLLIFSSVSHSQSNEALKFINNTAELDLLIGEWYFVSNQKGSPISAPPSFDIIEFLPQQKIRLRSTLDKYNFMGSVAVTGDTVSYTFQPPDVKEPIKHDVKMALSNSGGQLTLVYRQFNEERGVLYNRPALLLSADVVGEWYVEERGERAIMLFSMDGSFSLQNKMFGYYRAFNSYRGPAIMAALRYGGHDTLVFWLYERQGNKLRLTQVGGEIPQEQTVVWTLSD